MSDYSRSLEKLRLKLVVAKDPQVIDELLDQWLVLRKKVSPKRGTREVLSSSSSCNSE